MPKDQIMEKKLHRYENDQIEVTWDKNVCIHSAVCVKGLPGVFDTKKNPWINVDGGTTEEITNLIDRCPSGALQYKLKNA